MPKIENYKKISKNFQRPVANIFLSFLCNLNCVYCINKFHENNIPFKKIKIDHEYISEDKWYNSLNNFDNSVLLIFQGGEPTIYKNFHEIINHIDNDIWIYSNLFSNISIENLKKINREVLIVTSLHITDNINYKLHKIIENINVLNKIGFKVKIDMVNSPNLSDDHRKISENICCTIKDMIGYSDGILYGNNNIYDQIDAFSGKPRDVICSIKDELLIGPNGNIYSCCFGLYTDDEELVIGNIFDGIYNDQDEIYCKKYGLCNPCDFLSNINILKG